MGPQVKAGIIVGLIVVLLFAYLMVKLALIRTAILYGGALFTFGLLALLVAVVIVLFSMRARRVRY